MYDQGLPSNLICQGRVLHELQRAKCWGCSTLLFLAEPGSQCTSRKVLLDLELQGVMAMEVDVRWCGEANIALEVDLSMS